MEIACTWEGFPHDRGKCLHVVGLNGACGSARRTIVPREAAEIGSFNKRADRA
jgi:hypothetical protein